MSQKWYDMYIKYSDERRMILLVFQKLQCFVDSIVKQSPSHNPEELTRLNHYLWICLLTWPISILAISYNIFINHFVLAMLVAFFSLFLLFSLFILSYTRKIYLVYHGTNIVFFSLLLYMVYNADPIDSSRILWLYTYPLGAIFLFGNRTGFLWSTLLLISVCIVFIVVPSMQEIYNYPFQVRFGLTYAVVASMVSWIEFHRNRYQNESIQNHRDLLEEQRHLKEEIHKRTILEKELSYMAQTDSLTGCFNRHYFWETSQKELERSKRYKITNCLALLDIDNFKIINDTYGHPIGDKVLQLLSKHCIKSLRTNDIFARIGGEEFAFLLLHVHYKDAYAKMERLRQEIHDLSLHLSDEITVRFTVSIGMSLFDETAPSIDQLYKEADKQLYCAKNEGKNCTR